MLIGSLNIRGLGGKWEVELGPWFNQEGKAGNVMHTRDESKFFFGSYEFLFMGQQ